LHGRIAQTSFLARVTERIRKHRNRAFVGAAVIAWAVALHQAFAASEWTGFWSAPPTRGNTVAIQNKTVETEAERKKRLGHRNEELRDALSDLRKGVLGNRRSTRGDDPEAWDRRPSVPGDVADYTQRDACLQMKLEYPDRFKDVDCMSEDYDDSDPWFQSNRRR
jgi:hypothetical protein